jgi:hypothetical protein
LDARSFPTVHDALPGRPIWGASSGRCCYFSEP